MSARASALAAELAAAEPDPAGLDSDLENALLAGLSDAGDDPLEGPEEGAPALGLDDGGAPPPGEEAPGPAAPPAIEPALPAAEVSEGREDGSRTDPMPLASSRRSSDPEPVSGEEEDPIGLPGEPGDRPADEEDCRDGLLSRMDEEEPEEEAAEDLFSLAAAMDREVDDPFPPFSIEEALADVAEDAPVLGDAFAFGDGPEPEDEPARAAAAPGESFGIVPVAEPKVEADPGADSGHPAVEPAHPAPLAGSGVGPEKKAGAGIDAGLPAAEPAAAADTPAPFGFATDPESESALRAGLSDHPLPQVWPGGLRTAVATLGAGHAPRLLFVDLDETPYPAGAIHELASVCEVGTEVIAFGSNPTARFSREILLAGVSDYLVKPLTADAVREAAARVAGGEAAAAPGGWSVGFAGSGGSGSTTLAAATALLAAERGRYVSVLDLDRTFPALAFLLDVEPASGLVEVLSTAARASLHPEMVDAMRAKRSDRISVYGYPWSAVPAPPPPVWAVCELLQELQRRSHLVIVDGLDDPATRLALLAVTDGRVLVAEPTGAGARAAARFLDRLGPMAGPDRAALVVQNHTRAGKAKAGAKVLRDAGVEPAPEVVVPFEPALPAVTDRGWPNDRLPKPLRKPLDALVERVLAGERAASGAGGVRAGAPAARAVA